MKKIITFLVSVTMVASAFAQYSGGRDQRDPRDNGYGNNGYGNNGNNGYGNYDKGKDVVYNDGRYNDGRYNDNSFFKDFYVYTAREKETDIARINWNYDRKIQGVNNRFFMPRFKKEQIIYQLECQRKDEIKNVFAKFNSRKNRFDGFDHGSKDWDKHGDDHDQRRNW